MTDWSELAGKFKQDSTDARTAEERAKQKRDIVTAGGPGLWKQLEDASQVAVNAINKEAGNASLLLRPSDTEKSFSIIYTRPGGQHRTANAKFSPGTYKVNISFGGSIPHTTQNVEYDIRAEDHGDVCFHTPAGTVKVDDLVWRMLSELL